METTKEHQGEERMRNGGATRPSPRLRESWRWIMFPLAQLYSTCAQQHLHSPLHTAYVCFCLSLLVKCCVM